MNTLELKGSIFEMLAHIENEQDLYSIHDYLYELINHDADNNFWNVYSPEQKADLMQAFDESFDSDNWIEHEDVIKHFCFF